LLVACYCEGSVECGTDKYFLVINRDTAKGIFPLAVSVSRHKVGILSDLTLRLVEPRAVKIYDRVVSRSGLLADIQ